MNLLISRLDEQHVADMRRWSLSVWVMAATHRWHGSPDLIRRPFDVAAAS